MKMIEKIKRIDLRFFHALRSYTVSKITDKLLRVYIYIGDGYIWALVITYFAVFDGYDKMFDIIKNVLPTAILSLIVYHIIKLTVRRKRPYDLLPDVKRKISPMDKYSFPSGHTMNNLTVSFGLIYFLQPIGSIFIIILILMPISWGILRIYYGIHWLSDVIAGIVLAGLCFGIGLLLFSNIF